jgi:RNA polymerase sigma-70 factor (ECF subfamily)
VPTKPGAWLLTVARRHALDLLRREAVGATKQREAVVRQAAAGAAWPSDDRLELVFTCCHPALPLENQVALTLRTPTRLSAVLGVLYLVSNSGYDGSATLRSEALELARLLDRLMPDEPEVLGLLALMLLHDARTPSRGAAGVIIPLEEQDRTLWDAELIGSGLHTLDRALSGGRPGPYQVQAAIAACHVEAASVASTDWQQIAALYGLLAQLSPSPVVELNRAVAVAMAGRAAAALDLLTPLTEALRGYYLPATRADLLRRLARHAEARDAYRAAVDLAPGEPEREYLLRRLAEVS